jgi:glycosyltransferase involved in cell wall biosynthesis
MKVGIVISGYHRGAGLERVAVEYARGLAARGHEITVFAQRVKREAADDPIRFVRVGGATNQPALRAATFPLAATHMVEKTKLDNIVAFGSVVRQPAVLRTPGCHKSWWEVANREWPVTTFDGLRRRLNPHHRVVLWWDERVLGKGVAKAVLAAGDWAADDIKRFYPAVADRTSILPDGVNLDEFSYDPAGAQAMRDRWEVGNGPLLFTVATELRRKGLDTLFEAFRLIREEIPNARLVVGGRAPAGDIRALAVAHHVAREMRAVGFVQDLRAAYSAADVLMFPTRFDPWGLPVVEAIACGTPVAVSKRAGAASQVREGFSGAHVDDPANAAVVARAALDALALKPDRYAMRESVAHLDWSNVVGQLETVLARTSD